ncbi:MAG: site-specific integrase [Planctomycetia bacterium]|nr:site-specific integrase [Planctomycetia bacterium]
MASAWLFQDHKRKETLGADKCPWSVGWIDPDGRRKSKKIGTKSAAKKYASKVAGELTVGVYDDRSKQTWAEFRVESEKHAEGAKPQTRYLMLDALKNFDRLVKPGKVANIDTKSIDRFIERRRKEPGRKKGETVSPATVNKELRTLKAIFGIAKQWGYLAAVPHVRMLKEPGHIKRHVTAEHFGPIYSECDAATLPTGQPFPPGDWWRAMLVFLYLTGWRISEPLALRRDDLDLDLGTALTRAEDNKGEQDALVPLHPVIVEHLRKIANFGPLAFPWDHSRRGLWEQFDRIHDAAGIHLVCPKAGKHECTAACHRYSFHDLRRAFATANAVALGPEVLQKLMRHKSYTTTQLYINMASQLNQSVAVLQVPEVLKAKAGLA